LLQTKLISCSSCHCRGPWLFSSCFCTLIHCLDFSLCFLFSLKTAQIFRTHLLNYVSKHFVILTGLLYSCVYCFLSKTASSPEQQNNYLICPSVLSPSTSRMSSFSFFLWQWIVIVSLWLSTILDLFSDATTLLVTFYCKIDFSCLRGMLLTILLNCIFVTCLSVPFGNYCNLLYSKCVPGHLCNHFSFNIIHGVPSFA